MSFLRNPEIRQSLTLYLAFSLVLAAAGLALDLVVGLFVFCICATFTALHFYFTYRRYQQIAGLSQISDRILHSDDTGSLIEYSEGELAILQSEISKLTVQLREQAEALRKDRGYLADSIADISHQIRTPLTSINILVSRFSNPEISAAQRSQQIKEIQMLLSRIDWLISALLKIAKLDAGTANLQNQTVNVSELIQRASAALAIPMELREQQLHMDMVGDETYAGDLLWSVEAFANILKNCMEHTPNGGEIHISALENAIFTEIQICDNGCGIDPQDLPHLFERFYKGKNASSQSVGIGLALARMIIANQNGTIKADNNPNGGAQFTVRFYKGIV
ncbi:MAG TPA: HAMP domain-containing sensor histidine kinase [Anaerolineaceae bacterium]|nr:HAMP domain-containing sensor histidine kinase [Anaerolineaceae bacterium]